MIRVGHSLYTLPVIRCCDWKHVKSWSRRDLDCWPLRKYVSDLSINNVQKCTVRCKFSFFDRKWAAVLIKETSIKKIFFCILAIFHSLGQGLVWFGCNRTRAKCDSILHMSMHWEYNVTVIECKFNQQTFMFFSWGQLDNGFCKYFMIAVGLTIELLLIQICKSGSALKASFYFWIFSDCSVYQSKQRHCFGKKFNLRLFTF